MNTLNERLSEIIAQTRALLHTELVEDYREQVKRRDEKELLIHERMGEYEQYLLTLDPDMLLNIMDIWEEGSIFVTHPVEVRGIHDIALSVQHENLLCFGSQDIPNAQTVFAVPDGKYRFVLIAIPVGGEEVDDGI